jgi:hypothetical protein
MPRERTYKTRDRTARLAELPNLFAVPAGSASGGAEQVAGGQQAKNDAPPLDAQSVAQADNRIDSAQVQAFQAAGWQFVRPAAQTEASKGLMKVFVRPDGRLVIAPNRLTVKLADALTEADVERVLAQHGCRVLHRLKFAPNLYEVAVEPGAAKDVLDVAEDLAAVPGVEFAEPQLLEQFANRGAKPSS